MGTSGDQLILKRASASRPSGKWNEDHYDVLADRFGVIFITGNSFAVSPLFSLQNSEGVCDKTEILVVGAAQAGIMRYRRACGDNE